MHRCIGAFLLLFLSLVLGGCLTVSERPEIAPSGTNRFESSIGVAHDPTYAPNTFSGGDQYKEQWDLTPSVFWGLGKRFELGGGIFFIANGPPLLLNARVRYMWYDDESTLTTTSIGLISSGSSSAKWDSQADSTLADDYEKKSQSFYGATLSQSYGIRTTKTDLIYFGPRLIYGTLSVSFEVPGRPRNESEITKRSDFIPGIFGGYSKSFPMGTSEKKESIVADFMVQALHSPFNMRSDSRILPTALLTISWERY